MKTRLRARLCLVRNRSVATIIEKQALEFPAPAFLRATRDGHDSPSFLQPRLKRRRRLPGMGTFSATVNAT